VLNTSERGKFAVARDIAGMKFNTTKIEVLHL